MKVTVAICTWNRAALLDQTLERMKCLQIPDGVTWELLVVNNNCTDNTDEVLAKHGAGPLPLRRLFEPKQGHTNARNCAIHHSRGDLLIWTDDDVLVRSDWLIEYIRAATKFPSTSYFGGTVLPWFECDPPNWLKQGWTRLRSYYAIRELGSDVRPLAEGETVFGASMMFRTDVQRQFLFDPDRGHRAGIAIGGDETDVIDRMRSKGHHGVWVGTAIVEHFIPKERMSKRFIWNYIQQIGRRLRETVPDGTPVLWSAPRWMWRAYFTTRIQSAWASLRGDTAWADYFHRSAWLRARLTGFQAAATQSNSVAN